MLVSLSFSLFLLFCSLLSISSGPFWLIAVSFFSSIYQVGLMIITFYAAYVSCTAALGTLAGSLPIQLHDAVEK